MRVAPGPLFAALALAIGACAPPTPPAAPSLPAPAPPPPSPSAPPPAAPAPPPAPEAPEPAPQAKPESPCPDDMIHVDTSFCPKLERRCEDSEYNVPNHLLICHRFAEEQRCLVPEQRRQFCIDRYEYPNRAGAHPPVMVSWFDAQATCEARGKRLCWSGEWTAACEGPERTPFPYGRARDNTKCNIDNTWIDPRLRDLYAKDPRVAQRELSRLDQSAPSGAVEGCVSGFGVHDMTGNFDEWVTSEEPPSDKSQWAGLKGGAWGHVRNACRPMTTSHPPDFKYYFVSFRCCADAKGAPPFQPRGAQPAPKVEPADRAPSPEPVDPPGPSKKKVPRENDWKGPPKKTTKPR